MILKEFKKFALRGNVIDLAVGIIIGAAFNKIVDSLVKDIIMPPIGLLTNGMDFSNMYINLSTGNSDLPLLDAQAAGYATINYGMFLNNLVQFLIVAFSIFLVVRQINRFREREVVVKEKTTKSCPFCISEIPLKALKCPSCTSVLPEAKM